MSLNFRTIFSIYMFFSMGVSYGATPVFSVTGQLKNREGAPAGSALKVLIRNEANQKSAETTIDSEGKYRVTLVETDGASVVTVGDTLTVEIRDATTDSLILSRSKSLTQGEIDQAFAEIDFQILLKNRTPILVVAGRVGNLDISGAEAGSKVLIRNEANQKSAETTIDSEGKYRVTLIETDGASVATVGDILTVEIRDATTDSLILSRSRFLTQGEIDQAFAEVDFQEKNRTPILVIAGQLKGLDGSNAVAGLKVLVRNEANQKSAETITDSEGKYRITLIETDGTSVATVGDTLTVEIRDAITGRLFLIRRTILSQRKK